MRIVLIFLWTSLALAGNPPQLRPDAHNREQIVVLGHNVTVRCPILKPVDFVVWKHNAEELQLGLRYRPSHKGWLKIIHVGKGDAGRYTCQAVNGFGSVEANITLIVQDPHGDSRELIQENNFYPETDTLDGKEKSASTRPVLMEVSKFRQEPIQRPTGSSVIFKCLFDGSPKPKVLWSKNGQRLSQKDLNSESYMNRWTLHLFSLKESDSGLYTCVGHNPHGTANKNFTLEVIGRHFTKPEILGSEQVNITVMAGGTAIFYCRVKSAVKPHIKWLKQVKADDRSQKLLFENNENYKVLNSGDSMEHQKDIYLNKLQIANVRVSDTSKYVCFAANVQGYNVSTYYLQVVPLKNNRAEQDLSKSSSLPVTVIIISIVLVLVVIAIAVTLSRYRYTQVTKGQPLNNQLQVEDQSSNEPLEQLHHDSISQGGSATHKSSHYHNHQHHHHHHYRYKT